MTKKVDTWMPLLVDKYLGDTTHLTTEQHGAYLLLLMSMWKKDGRLADDDVQLAQIAHLSPAKWRSLRPILVDGSLLRTEGGWVMQKRLTAELERSKAATNAKAEAGKKGAAKKWQKASSTDGEADGNEGGRTDGEADGNEGGRTDGEAMAVPSVRQWQTGASIHTPIPLPSGVGSDADASGAAAPPSQGLTAKDRLWALVPLVLGERGRALAGKLVATYGDEAVADVLAEAHREHPLEPKSWVVAACEARAKPKPRTNGNHADSPTTRNLLDRDPWAPWLTGTGFGSIFEAESAGCGPGNAHKFRDGRRVTQ